MMQLLVGVVGLVLVQATRDERDPSKVVAPDVRASKQEPIDQRKEDNTFGELIKSNKQHGLSIGGGLHDHFRDDIAKKLGKLEAQIDAARYGGGANGFGTATAPSFDKYIFTEFPSLKEHLHLTGGANATGEACQDTSVEHALVENRPANKINGVLFGYQHEVKRLLEYLGAADLILPAYSIPSLAGILAADYREAKMKIIAAALLGFFGECAASAAPYLGQALASMQAGWRCPTGDVAGTTRERDGVYEKLWNSNVKEAVLLALQSMGEGAAPAAEPIAAALQDEYYRNRVLALDAIEALGSAGFRFAQDVASLLADDSGENYHVSWKAIHTLEAMGPGALVALDKIVEKLKACSPEPRLSGQMIAPLTKAVGAVTLEGTGAVEPAEVARVLQQVISFDDYLSEKPAHDALFKLSGVYHEELEPELVSIFANSSIDDVQRVQALQMVSDTGNLSEASATILPDVMLQGTAGDECPRMMCVWAVAATYLGAMDNDRVQKFVPQLEQALDHELCEVRVFAVNLLGRLGTEGAAAATNVAEALRKTLEQGASETCDGAQLLSRASDGKCYGDSPAEAAWLCPGQIYSGASEWRFSVAATLALGRMQASSEKGVLMKALANSATRSAAFSSLKILGGQALAGAVLYMKGLKLPSFSFKNPFSR